MANIFGRYANLFGRYTTWHHALPACHSNALPLLDLLLCILLSA